MDRQECEKNKANKNLGYMHIFHVLTIFVIVFFIICYIVFAFVPEKAGFSFPTGGWDWLSFVGGLAGMLIASWGVITTIDNNHEVAMQQAVLSVRPILNIAVFNNFQLQFPCELQGIYLPYFVSNRVVTIDGDFLFLSNMLHNFEKDNQQCLIQLRNIGLGSAINIRVRIYEIQSVAGQEPSKFEIKSIEEFYNNIKLGKAPKIKYAGGSIISESVYEIPQFHLNNSTDSFNIVMGQREFSGQSAYYILELVYQDAYENTNYMQYHHLRIEEKMCMYFSTSAQKIIN